MYEEKAFMKSIGRFENGTLRGAPATKMVPYTGRFDQNGTLRGALPPKWYPTRGAFGPEMVPYAGRLDEKVDASMTNYLNENA